MLECSKITKKFGDLVAVDSVSFSIREGEIFSLIGPNGSGKTTIVKLIAGLLFPDGGKITVGGVDTFAHPVEAKAKIGYIPDDPLVWPAMTGEEFLHFVGALYGISGSARARKIAELLPVFELGDMRDHLFEDYSRGSKQKFSILASLLHEPKLLLIDEPIVGLDPASAMIAKKLFQDFAKRGGAILLVTHTLSVAEEIATLIGVLKNGSMVA